MNRDPRNAFRISGGELSSSCLKIMFNKGLTHKLHQGFHGNLKELEYKSDISIFSDHQSFENVTRRFRQPSASD